MPRAEAQPRCPDHALALEPIRVEIPITRDKVVTDGCGCSAPGCKTESYIRQGAEQVNTGKQQVMYGSHCITDTLRD